MRDHPHHSFFFILGGMFGTRKIKNIPKWKDIIYLKNQKGQRMYDMDFLRDKIYPIIKDDCMIHDNFWRKENHCQYFSTKYNSNCDFVGMYVNPDGSRSERHMKIIQDKVNELKSKGILL